MNRDIIENLDILGRYYKATGDKWRQQAYQQAVIAVKGLDFEITDIKHLKNTPRIGKSILDKIKEYLDAGQIRKVEEVKQLGKKAHVDKKDFILEEFQTVWGIGPAKARNLYGAGMRSLKDLRSNQQLLSSAQRIGLKYHEDLGTPIPREYIDIFQLATRVIITKEFGINSFRMHAAGSYRRNATQSGDIDLLITSKVFYLKQLVDVLVKWGVIVETLALQNEKFMGIAHCPNGQWHYFRLDIEFLPDDEYGAGLLYFTGSKAFNLIMRQNAKRLGFTLNQHGLFDAHTGSRIPIYTEKELMSAVGMKYVPPENR